MKLNELVKERDELTVKITELENFLSENQDLKDKNLLIAQLHAMKMYRDILSIRINNTRLVVYNNCLHQLYAWLKSVLKIQWRFSIYKHTLNVLYLNFDQK